jgi:hypothetical protein
MGLLARRDFVAMHHLLLEEMMRELLRDWRTMRPFLSEFGKEVRKLAWIDQPRF